MRRVCSSGSSVLPSKSSRQLLNGCRLLGHLRAFHGQLRVLAAFHVRPAVAPFNAGDAGLAPQRAVAAPAGGQQRHAGQAQRAAGEVGHVPLPGVGLQQRAVAALLQRVLRQVPAGHHRHVRVQLVRPVDVFERSTTTACS
jgi:hypothetical protein